MAEIWRAADREQYLRMLELIAWTWTTANGDPAGLVRAIELDAEPC